ncbi:MAG: hypothetical protein HY560_03640 [Gemmatimonadetes bacterium]|nr:hypothetical protein [Gemmatimonadota bacterium]
MKTLRMPVIAAAAVLGLGCAVNPAPVTLVADPKGEQLLAGEWVGQYFSDAGREGSIAFSLVPHDTTKCGGHGEHAHGDVLMIPRGTTQMLRPAMNEDEGQEHPTPAVLTIELIRVTGDRVTGYLTPYRDPDTGVILSTTFEGQIVGDRITGTMTTINGKTGERLFGRWEVVRRH